MHYPMQIIRDVYFLLRPVLVFEITKTRKFPVKFDLKLGVQLKSWWQIRPISVTIWLHILTDSILGVLVFVVSKN